MSKKAKTSTSERTTDGKRDISKGTHLTEKSSMGTAMEKPIERQKKK